MADPETRIEKTWQQTKSEQTRENILSSAIACFYDLGYASTTTDNIARRAGVSRGAMLHHFPTRFELISAAIQHLSDRWLQRFTEVESRVNEGADHTRVGEGIDAYWELLNSPDWVVFNELKVAARTDQELEQALVPALKGFGKAMAETAQELYPQPGPLGSLRTWQPAHHLPARGHGGCQADSRHPDPGEKGPRLAEAGTGAELSGCADHRQTTQR